MDKNSTVKVQDDIMKPFLRWAGGKRWLIKHFDNLLPIKFNNYHEPFLGGASIFLYLKSKNKINGHSFLSDFNSDLINVYKQLQKNPVEVIKNLEKYKNEKETYYYVRGLESKSNIEKAAIFIYLNRTSYNGIYRVNRAGKYNVPYGYRTGKNLLDNTNLLPLSKLFNQRTSFLTGDFDIIKNNLKKNDLVFLDPPYTVAHENNGFVQYNQQIFSWEDQERLALLLKFISTKKAFFILTNAAHVSISELFQDIGSKIKVQRYSTIGGKGANRNQVNEYIFTNIYHEAGNNK